MYVGVSVCVGVLQTQHQALTCDPCTAAGVRPVAAQPLAAVWPGTSLDYLFHTITSTQFLQRTVYPYILLPH